MPMERRLKGATTVDCGSGGSTRWRVALTGGARASPASARAARSAWMSWAMSWCGSAYLVRQLPVGKIGSASTQAPGYCTGCKAWFETSCAEAPTVLVAGSVQRLPLWHYSLLPVDWLTSADCGVSLRTRRDARVASSTGAYTPKSLLCTYSNTSPCAPAG